MKSGVRPLERAFQLARSGSVRSVEEVKYKLEREGYSSGEIEGRQVRMQLRALIDEVKAPRDAQ